MIKNYNHSSYVVDGYFRRSVKKGEKEYRYTVNDLTEQEAKDLVCNLMDCVGEIGGQANKVRAILAKYNFSA